MALQSLEEASIGLLDPTNGLVSLDMAVNGLLNTNAGVVIPGAPGTLIISNRARARLILDPKTMAQLDTTVTTADELAVSATAQELTISVAETSDSSMVISAESNVSLRIKVEGDNS